MKKRYLFLLACFFLLPFLGNSQTWNTITTDITGDGSNGSLLDGTQLDYFYDASEDSLWFRITNSSINNSQASDLGFNIMVNYNGGGTTF